MSKALKHKCKNVLDNIDLHCISKYILQSVTNIVLFGRKSYLGWNDIRVLGHNLNYLCAISLNLIQIKHFRMGFIVVNKNTYCRNWKMIKKQEKIEEFWKTKILQDLANFFWKSIDSLTAHIKQQSQNNKSIFDCPGNIVGLRISIILLCCQYEKLRCKTLFNAPSCK